MAESITGTLGITYVDRPDDVYTAKTYAATATNAADAAKTAQTAAATSETNAKTSETNAASSASAANTSDTNAAASATTATSKASDAASSATAAKTSETNAKLSEESASSSASQASSYASGASTSASNAKDWAESTSSPDGNTDTASSTGSTQSAKSWALDAESSATTATSKASAAATSETNAATSKTAAATSETNAKTSETNAKTSETNASASASASASSASASATSATNAHNSETAAANSAKQAAESAGVFQDFKGATASSDGLDGKVPKPLAGQQNKVLKADGTWGDGVTPITLWEGMHAYPRNYVPSDASNVGWNKLGFCSIVYDTFVFNNQPTLYGQLINIPITKDDTGSTQLWIDQPSGLISFRGGHTSISINDAQFKTVATTDDVNAREKVNSQGSNWIRYESGLQLCWTESVGGGNWWSFPVAFSSPPVVQFTDVTGDWSWVSDIHTTGCTHKGSGTANSFAIGRWK